MKITTPEQLLELAENTVILTSDGVPAQLVINPATYRRDRGGRHHWQRTDGTYLTHPFSRLLPATVLIPSVITQKQLANAADMFAEEWDKNTSQLGESETVNVAEFVQKTLAAAISALGIEVEK